MAHPFGSREWAAALQDEINGSSEYRNAAAQWGVGFNGNMLFVFEADALLARPRQLLMQLPSAGSCSGAEFVDDGVGRAGFVLRAPFALWKEILERRTLAATAIMTGRLKVDGEKMLLLRHTAANRALVHCTASVETAWPATP